MYSPSSLIAQVQKKENTNIPATCLKTTAIESSLDLILQIGIYSIRGFMYIYIKAFRQKSRELP